MNYHKVELRDCLSVASPREKVRLSMITDINLLKELASKWCSSNGYKLGGYLGNDKWDATREELQKNG